MRRLLYTLIFTLFAAATGTAAPPAHPRLNLPPPGQVVQRTVAYLTGEAMHSAWYVVSSRKLAGTNAGGTRVYQWYLSFYAPDGNDGGRLVYQLPNAGNETLARVVRAHGVQMYFPQQSVRIAGAAELRRQGVQDVVAVIHQSAADCGTTQVIVFGADRLMHVRERVNVENPCDLQASIVKHGALSTVRLRGPYYAPDAARCCPTKPHAEALLIHSLNGWRVEPRYFTIHAR